MDAVSVLGTGGGANILYVFMKFERRRIRLRRCTIVLVVVVISNSSSSNLINHVHVFALCGFFLFHSIGAWSQRKKGEGCES